MVLRDALFLIALTSTLTGCQSDDRDGAHGGAGTGPGDDGAAGDIATGADAIDTSDAGGPLYTRCIDVQGPRGCCVVSSTPNSYTSTNYYFENGRVVTHVCVAGQPCGYSKTTPGELGYRCGGTGIPGPEDVFDRCGYSLKSGSICAALGDGPATSPDATFPCGANGLRCEIGKQYCLLVGDSININRDTCMPLPARCASPNATCASCEPIEPRPPDLYRCDDVNPGAMVVTSRWP